MNIYFKIEFENYDAYYFLSEKGIIEVSSLREDIQFKNLDSEQYSYELEILKNSLNSKEISRDYFVNEYVKSANKLNQLINA